MNTFNLSNYFRVIEAMAGGTESWQYRNPGKWWRYEDLINNPPEDWKQITQSEPTVQKALKEIGADRGNIFKNIKKEYPSIAPEESQKLLKTLVHYDPVFGIYSLQVGPYLSIGYKFGIEHKQELASHKFYYGTKRIRYATEAEVMESLTKYIKDYAAETGVTLDYSDFAVRIMERENEFDPSSEKQSNRKESLRIDNLDPSNPMAQSFYQQSPLMTQGSFYELNPKGQQKMNIGYINVLKEMLGDQYDLIIQQKAIEENKTKQQIEEKLLTDTKFLTKIYNTVYNKWKANKFVQIKNEMPEQYNKIIQIL